jgi:lipocalin
MPTARLAGVLALTAMLAACSSMPTIPTAERVDLERFMGDW